MRTLKSFWPIGFSSSWILSISKTNRVCFTFWLIPNRRLTVKLPKNYGGERQLKGRGSFKFGFPSGRHAGGGILEPPTDLACWRGFARVTRRPPPTHVRFPFPPTSR